MNEAIAFLIVGVGMVAITLGPMFVAMWLFSREEKRNKKG